VISRQSRCFDPFAIAQHWPKFQLEGDFRRDHCVVFPASSLNEGVHEVGRVRLDHSDVAIVSRIVDEQIALCINPNKFWGIQQVQALGTIQEPRLGADPSEGINIFLVNFKSPDAMIHLICNICHSGFLLCPVLVILLARRKFSERDVFDSFRVNFLSIYHLVLIGIHLVLFVLYLSSIFSIGGGTCLRLILRRWSLRSSIISRAPLTIIWLDKKTTSLVVVLVHVLQTFYVIHFVFEEIDGLQPSSQQYLCYVPIIDADGCWIIEDGLVNVPVTVARLKLLPRDLKHGVPSGGLLRNVQNGVLRLVRNPQVPPVVHVEGVTPQELRWGILQNHPLRITVIQPTAIVEGDSIVGIVGSSGIDGACEGK